jgi:hypothetical protein
MTLKGRAFRHLAFGKFANIQKQNRADSLMSSFPAKWGTTATFVLIAATIDQQRVLHVWAVGNPKEKK